MLYDGSEDIMIVVAGGPNPYHLVNIPTFGETLSVTREVTDRPHSGRLGFSAMGQKGKKTLVLRR